MAYTAILSASYFQAEARRVDISKHVEGIAIKAKIISMINDYIKDHRGAVSDEMISLVNHLLVSEARFLPHLFF